MVFHYNVKRLKLPRREHKIDIEKKPWTNKQKQNQQKGPSQILLTWTNAENYR